MKQIEEEERGMGLIIFTFFFILLVGGVITIKDILQILKII